MFGFEGKKICVLGDDESVINFKKTHADFDFSDEIDMSDVESCYFVTGKNWLEYAKKLEDTGNIFWKNIFPDWISLFERNHFEYEKLKKYTNNDFEDIDNILTYIEEYKNIAVVYGNCQSLYISLILAESRQFSNDYILMVMLPVQNIEFEKIKGFDKRVMKHISCFIYQKVKRDNAFGEKLSTDELIPMLKPECKKCTIPFVYLLAYFPQHIKNPRNDMLKRGEGHYPYGDRVIRDCLESGKSVDETARNLADLSLFSEEEVQENYKNSLQELKKREENLDVIISDFLEKNFKSKYLFYTPSHPTNECMVEVVYRILNFFGYEYEKIDYSNVIENDRYEMYIYPSVKKKLGLTFPKSKFRPYKASGCYMNIKEFVNEYKKYCFPELNDDIKVNFRTIDISHMLTLNDEIVEHRRTPVVELSGLNIHVSLYLTLKVNVSGITNVCRINSFYAPRYLFIFSGINPITSESFPCILYPDGRLIINGKAEIFRRGGTIVLELMYFKK